MNAREDSETRDLTPDELHQVCGGTAAGGHPKAAIKRGTVSVRCRRGGSSP
jgi:hypothetical protein